MTKIAATHKLRPEFLIQINHATKQGGGPMAAEAKAAAAEAQAELNDQLEKLKLDPEEKDLLLRVLAAHPTLTVDEALQRLRLSGM